MVGIVEDDVPSKGIRDYAFEVPQLDVLVDGDKAGRSIQRNDLPVIAVRETDGLARAVHAFVRS